MYRTILPACMHGYHMSAWCLRMSEDGVGSPETGVRDGCK